MSKATRQAITLLAAIGGNLYDLKRRNLPGDAETAGLIWAAYLETQEVMVKWPVDNFDQKQKDWVSERLEQWHALFLPDLEYYFQAQVVLCMRCLGILCDVTQNKYKLELLHRLSNALFPLDLAVFGESMVYDEQAHDEADRMLTVLKILIEWRQ